MLLVDSERMEVVVAWAARVKAVVMGAAAAAESSLNGRRRQAWEAASRVSAAAS